MWDAEEATAQKFATRLGATAVAKYDGMVEQLDGGSGALGTAASKAGLDGRGDV